MQSIRLWYFAWCKKHGPDNLTFSAYAWKTQSRWVVFIDFLFALFGQRGHCKAQYARETAAVKGRT